MDSLNNVVKSCLKKAIKPLVKLCLKNCVTIQEVESILKEIFVNVAAEILSEKKTSINKSRVSAMTGIYRKDVSRILENHTTNEKPALNVATEVLNIWSYNPDFQNTKGKPKKLSYKGEKSEFHKLVKSISNNYSPSALLKHLETQELVVITRNGLKLNKLGYFRSNNAADGMLMLGEDIGDLIDSVYENITNDSEPPNLHATTEYPNIKISAKDEIQSWIMNEGAKFHARIRRYLSSYDSSIDRLVNSEETVTVVISTFSKVKEK